MNITILNKHNNTIIINHNQQNGFISKFHLILFQKNYICVIII